LPCAASSSTSGRLGQISILSRVIRSASIVSSLKNE
jgi:hypothetical protein